MKFHVDMDTNTSAELQKEKPVHECDINSVLNTSLSLCPFIYAQYAKT